MLKKYDVYGMGNALVDFLVEVDDNILKELDFHKGRFHLIGEKQSKRIFDKIKYAQMSIVPGGSAANAVATISMLGGKALFYGKVGVDEYGEFYEKETSVSGTDSKIKKNKGLTGHCIVLITPDAERTLAVNLGISNKLNETEIMEEEIQNAQIFHIDGYLIDQAKHACMHAIKLAKKNNVKISLDVSDAGVIERNKENFLHIIKNYVNIIFANEQEAKVLTGKVPEEAIKELAQFCETVIIKLGDKGSIIWHKEKLIKINAVKTNAIDTTGAGDAYAGGFLYGLTKSMSLEESGKLASALASKVVSKIGARLTREEINEARK